jgi:hypothetical protein
VNGAAAETADTGAASAQNPDAPASLIDFLSVELLLVIGGVLLALALIGRGGKAR